LRRRLFLHLAAIAAIGTAPAAALSHAFLDAAIPLVGGTVPASPKEIRLTFTEAIEPRFSGIDLVTEDGRAISTARAAAAAARSRPLSGALACRVG
jgi:hypothetical protein